MAERAPRVDLRSTSAGDCERVWRWRNEPGARAASFNSDPIPFETHQAWFAESLERSDRRMYVVVADGVECGVVRLDISGSEAEVSIHLAADKRSRGVGPAALEAIADQAFTLLGLERLVARIKPDNQVSIAAFERAGFVQVKAEPTVLTFVRKR